jgi:hypothetical protein
VALYGDIEPLDKAGLFCFSRYYLGNPCGIYSERAHREWKDRWGGYQRFRQSEVFQSVVKINKTRLRRLKMMLQTLRDHVRVGL